MARQKRTSAAVKTATGRAAKLASIDPNLDLGNGLDLGSYRTKIKAVDDANDAYNTKLSSLDGDLNNLQAAEKELATLSANMLAQVKIKYGGDSTEYEQAGGTRTSERKSRTPKPAVKPQG